MKIELPNGGSNVIKLEVISDGVRGRQYAKKCPHFNVTMDKSLALLKCNACGETLNPIEWIAMMAENWSHVQYLTKQYFESKAAYEGKQRCRCQHCGKLTKVKPLSAAEVRKMKTSPRQDDGAANW